MQKSSGKKKRDHRTRFGLVKYKRQNPNHEGSNFAVMVEHRGFEPLASTMRMSRATNCANAPNIHGKFYADSPITAYGVQNPWGDSRDNSFYQLCYSPIFIFPPNKRLARALSWRPGLEPANDIIANRPSECNTPPQIFFGVRNLNTDSSRTRINTGFYNKNIIESELEGSDYNGVFIRFHPCL